MTDTTTAPPPYITLRNIEELKCTFVDGYSIKYLIGVLIVYKINRFPLYY